MNISAFFKKNWIHFAILASFLITMFAYFSVQFDGHGLKQHDVEQYKGMANEIIHYRELTGEEPLWTNSMFGGMPAAQISVIYYGNIFKNTVRAVLDWFPSPAGIFFLHLIGFYFLGLCLRLKPLISALGAFAFAFASYEIVILQAGHNSKALAVAFTPAVVGAFVMAYRRNWKWGAVLSMAFMALELAQNHFQVTYYVGILLLFLGIYEFSRVFTEKNGKQLSQKLKGFAIPTFAILGGYLVALMINYGNITITNDYAKHTIRGKNDVTINPDGSEKEKITEGLDRDYITNWSYGIDESFTLISPYVKGSHSQLLQNTAFKDWVKDSDRSRADKKRILEARYGLYFGEQPGTSGPVYIGVVVIFLALLGIVFLKDNSKWIYLFVSILALMLSWGKNFMGLTDFFIDYVPLYDKFRTVTIILILIELCLPIIGVLVLQQLWENREELKGQSKKFLAVAGIFLLFLFGLKFAGVNSTYASQGELEQMENLPDQLRADYAQQIYQLEPEVLAANNIDLNNEAQVEQLINQQVESTVSQANAEFEAIQDFRKEMESTSNTRSLIFGILAVGAVALFFYTAVPSFVVVLGLILLILADLVPVDRQYLGEVTDGSGKLLHWEDVGLTKYPVSANAADYQVLESEKAVNSEIAQAVQKGEERGRKKVKELGYSSKTRQRIIDSYVFQSLNFASNYRVWDADNSLTGSSRASYFHKSIGGYHGAKLQNYQNVIEFHISQQNNDVLDMLNVKYVLYQGKAQQRYSAMGNCWLVKDVKVVDNENDEITALDVKLDVTNVGSGKLLINGEQVKSGKALRASNVQYIAANGDTLSVPFKDKMTQTTDAYFVQDVKGNSNFVIAQAVENDELNSFTKMLKISLNSKFDPRTNAVMLKSESESLKAKSFSGEGRIDMLSYAPNKITYEADVKGDQLAVFSEIYYKDGWKAFVDGKEQKILKVNYLLRGLELTNGKHKVEFLFDLPAYSAANKMAYAGSTFIVLMILALLFLEFRKKKGGIEPKTEDEK